MNCRKDGHAGVDGICAHCSREHVKALRSALQEIQNEMLMKSLEEADGGYAGDWIRRIETLLMDTAF